MQVTLAAALSVLLALALGTHVALVEAVVPRILIQTKVSPGAYYHESIPTAVDIITRLGTGAIALNDSVADPLVANADQKWEAVHIDDDKPMENATYLAGFDAIVFVSTNDQSPPNSGSILSDAAAKQLAAYIQMGGGFVGVHSATATMFTWPFYGRLIGAFFDYHPEIQEVGIKALNNDHPSTSRFPALLNIDEEVYHYRTDPRALPEAAQVLLSNGTAFQDPQAASRTRSDGPPPRPLAWWREGRLLDEPATALGEGMGSNGSGPGATGGGPGRMFYTSLGHATATWMIPAFQGHVAGGIAWVLASSSTSSNNSSASVGSSSSNSSASSSSQGGSASGAAAAAAADAAVPLFCSALVAAIVACALSGISSAR